MTANPGDEATPPTGRILRVACFGDVVGRPGILVLERRLREVREAFRLDFVIANAENAEDGSGVTPAIATKLLAAGVDVMTSGDHIPRRRAVFPILAKRDRLLRPANYPPEFPGGGVTVVDAGEGDDAVPIAVVNVLGRLFMNTTLDCPFRAVDGALAECADRARVILVDVHAEATSEKVALGWHLDGRVSAVFGTHTHVPTADERILPRGTAYVTDIGMTGPHHSVIGRKIEPVLRKMITQVPERFVVATDDARATGAIFSIDSGTGRAVAVHRIQVALEGPLPTLPEPLEPSAPAAADESSAPSAVEEAPAVPAAGEKS